MAYATLTELLGDKVRYEIGSHYDAVETEFSGALVEAMQACLQAEDAQAKAVPFLMSGGTDAKAWSKLGVRCFGFAPLQLPPDLDFVAMFHGVDERVPTASLEFGARVLDRFLDQAAVLFIADPLQANYIAMTGSHPLRFQSLQLSHEE